MSAQPYQSYRSLHRLGTGCSAFGVYDDKTPVGFLTPGFNEGVFDEQYGEEIPDVLYNNYSLWHLMINENHQKKGYGKEAVRLALEFIRTFPCGKAECCVLSYETENTVAQRLYASCGFVENGDTKGDEIVAVLKL